MDVGFLGVFLPVESALGWGMHNVVRGHNEKGLGHLDTIGSRVGVASLTSLR